ncbi:hypothetical protein PFAG_05589 [Plasmodium falciparum Santa Lucia]|uniref:Uncharacterized protein n=12 Tax=Plasmodium falciparum TaxID=5833 RepID=Q8IKX7_PLAF7|nr:conserved protein, unknown function [Plasmodium falciparum 3D7]ETW16018.1 hypothetical protein PFFVO_05120 [Plasmodium falciparum Vietnam Oak-Knoll (FVO)]ETW29023.1 hypothetical protein PFFCH_03534 [Plasmodium falciparum FCH/4]ETW33847.1 hypothetical protein PFTANZ_05476 [Plasmodium falciparum Tanzania (2000708)]ETW39765.1 hypothetical protein PFNF135_05794 [Plasmodium falciparum NF135/5.C10]ETW46421.1 hypothetical protein PFMALIP_05327 [Plasmodium falciparum MaliPS096_E11]ETW54157.1 hypot|eukprot:XP_001348648.1 conserved Plasmodium protein, unknown function [Plasmodium falciparum 3D7]
MASAPNEKTFCSALKEKQDDNEKQNIGSFTSSCEEEKIEEHALYVPENLVCLICYDDIDESNYIEYKTDEHSKWYPSKFCLTCTGILIDSQYEKYINSVQKSECLKEQTSLLKMGPPINVKDKNGYPQSDDKEIYSLWYFCDKKIHSAKLKGSLMGEERMKLWNELKNFLIKEDKKD